MSTKASSHHIEHETAASSTDQLVGDFKALMTDVEALILATASHSDGPISAIRGKALESLASAKESLSTAQGPITEKVKELAEGTDDFVHRNPWEAIGVAAGLGLLIGLFISRR